MPAFEPGPEPLAVFQRWFDEALALGEPMPEAVALATVGEGGAPSVRMVLFRGFVRGGFAFYTNYESRKGRELDANPRVALCFHFTGQERQVRVEGRAARTTREESEAYFATRPRDSQLGAWASAQSRPLQDRETLIAAVEAARGRYEGGAVPCPPHWGGFRVEPERVELWQGGEFRLHDRFLYERHGDGWSRVRLSP